MWKKIKCLFWDLDFTRRINNKSWKPITKDIVNQMKQKYGDNRCNIEGIDLRFSDINIAIKKSNKRPLVKQKIIKVKGGKDGRKRKTRMGKERSTKTR